MYVSMKEILDRAHAEGYGVPAVGGFDECSVRASIEAAEELNAPIILLNPIQVNAEASIFYGNMVRSIANDASVPVATCLDHSSTFAQAINGIRAGFTGIMVDRSKLPYEENVKEVKDIVRICHSIGIPVEAELGHVGRGETYEVDGASALTVPEEAKRFVEETEVDCLAVAIGTAHGVYKGTPKIRFDLLEEINKVAGVPLVLHGGSGSGDDNITKACTMGIAKVNIGNDILRASFEGATKGDMSGNNVYGFFPKVFEYYKARVKDHIKVTGCEDKAWGGVRVLEHKKVDLAEA